MTEILAGVEALTDRVRKASDDMRRERRVSGDIVDELRELGAFDMALPASMGGPGLTPLEQFDVIETLSLADASVGWCVMIGADSGYYPGFLGDDAFAELYPHRGLVTAGKVAPSGKAVPVEGGWRVTGRWDFGSGSTHADRFVGGVFLCDEAGEVRPGEGNLPEFRAAYLPRDAVVVHDTWDTVGLRATASNDYEVADAFVPDHHLWNVMEPMVRRDDDPLYRLSSWFLYKGAGILTALARRAIDEAVAAARDKALLPEFVTLADRPGTQETVARCEAAARSARSFVRDEIARVWELCVSGAELSPETVAPMRLAMVNASQVAVDVTRAMFDLLTTTSIRSDSIHAHLLADAEVANTHVATSHRSWVPLGARLSGREPSSPALLFI